MFSQIQQTCLLLAALAAPSAVNAHGKVWQWTMVKNDGSTVVKPGQDYGKTDKTAQRQVTPDLLYNDGPRLPDNTTHEIFPDAVCHSVQLSSGETWDLEGVKTLIAHWSHSEKKDGVTTLDRYWPTGHGGPAIEYMAACSGDSCDNFDPVNADWFKTGESVTYDGKWASEKVHQDGEWPITIPTDLKPGDYILRHELISVHGVPGQPQMYPVCIQVKLGGSGTTVPSKMVKLPAAYTEYDATFMNYQIQAGVDDHAPNPTRHFAAPGPPIYNGAKGGDAGGTSVVSVSETPITSSTAAPTSSSVGQTVSSSFSDSSSPASSATSIQAGADTSASSVSASGTAAASSTSAYTAPSAGDSELNLQNKGVVVDGSGSSSLEKPLPSQAGASGDTGTSSSESVSSSASTMSSTSTSGSALAAGAVSTATSASGSSVSSPASTGTSEYASNIQGGTCKIQTWRCQKYPDGRDFLQVCGQKTPGIDKWEWVPSNPECPARCDDSKPADPICQ